MQTQEECAISTADIVQIVIALAFETEKLYTITEEAIYCSLKKMTEEFPSQFGGLPFRILPISGFPYSGELEDTLFRLSSAGIINRTGWKMSSFTMDKKMIKMVQENFVKHHGQQLFNEVRKLSQRFLELIQEYDD